DVVDAGAEIGDQLQVRAGAHDHLAVDLVGDGGDQHVRLLHRLDQLGLAHRAVVDVETGVEQLAHARLDRVGQFARDDDERLFRGHFRPKADGRTPYYYGIRPVLTDGRDGSRTVVGVRHCRV